MSTIQAEQYREGPWQAYKERRGPSRPSSAAWFETVRMFEQHFADTVERIGIVGSREAMREICYAAYCAGIARGCALMTSKEASHAESTR